MSVEHVAVFLLGCWIGTGALLAVLIALGIIKDRERPYDPEDRTWRF